MVIRTNNTERLRISADGNVRIGAGNATAPLDIQNFGTAALFSLGGGGTAYSLINLRSSNGSNNRSVISIGNQPDQAVLTFGAGYEGDYGTSFEIRSDIMGAGAGGAGYANLGQALVIKRQSTDGTTSSVATMLTAPTDIGIVAGGYTVPGGASWSMSRMVIKADGNVGIGTTTPTSKLVVNATANATNRIIIDPEYASLRSNIRFRLAGWGPPQRLWGVGADWDNGSFAILYEGISADNFSNPSRYLLITHTGNVGIGTTTPSQRLHVSASADPLRLEGLQTDNTLDQVLVANSSGVVRLRSASSLASSTAWSLTGNSGTNPATNFLGTTDGQPLVIRTNNAERLRIDPSGNVGIGTSAPTARLEVGGDVRMTGGTLLGGKTAKTYTAAELNAKLGFNVTDPAQQYQQNQVIYNDFYGGSIAHLWGHHVGSWLFTIYDQSGYGPNGFFFGKVPYGGGSATFFNDGSVMMVLRSTGNLGLNTLNPTHRLHVVASADPLRLEGLQTDNTLDQVLVANSSGVVRLRSASSLASSSAWSLTGNSGTNPATNFLGTTDNQPLVIRTNNTEQVRITTSGNIGIGTTTPNARLGVIGNAAIGTTYGSAAAPPNSLIVEGKIGIGTTTPSPRLHVVAPEPEHGLWVDATDVVGAGLPVIIRANTTGKTFGTNTYGRLLRLQDVRTGAGFYDIGINANGGFFITTNSSSVEGLTLSATSNVGIGTATPLGNGFDLHLGGDNEVALSFGTNATASNNAHIVLNDHGGQRGLRMYSGNYGAGSLLMTVLNSGDVGIGPVATPSHRLHVVASADPLRLEGLQTDNTLNQVLVVTSSGVVKTRAANTLGGGNAWNLTGNSGTNPATNFLGTTDNQPLVIRTNNQERLRVDQSGNLCIGTTTASGLLTITNDEEENFVILTNASDNADNAPKIRFRRSRGTPSSPTIGSAGDYIGDIAFQQFDGTTFRNSAMISATIDGTPGTNNVPGALHFRTRPNNGSTLVTRMTINEAGNVIIGNHGTIPLSTYNTGFDPSTIIAGNNRDLVLASFSSGSALAKADIEFFRARGTPSSPEDVADGDGLGQIGFGMYQGGAIRTRRAAIAALVDGAPGTNDYPTRLEFYTTPDGSATEALQMVIKNNGNVGLGVANPTYQLQLSTDQAAKTSTNTWTVISDQRLKTVVGHYTKGLQELLQLEPILYQYKNTADYQFDPAVLSQVNVGFVAQDVQRIFPEAVVQQKDGYLGLNTHPILVAYLNAFKELHQRVETLEKQEHSSPAHHTSSTQTAQDNTHLLQRIAQLEQQVHRLENLVRHLTAAPEQRAEPWLGDNIPNPHDGTTTIPYYVPSSISLATLRLSNLSGEILLEVNLPVRNQPSQITLAISSYPSGTYDYSLVLDGRTVATKRMQLVK
ncbi:MAG: tail fiber domain-containing protein [Bacteroidota bacterium]|nr:tail fiber domain-containing protein [Bacteroidota bacterium]